MKIGAENRQCHPYPIHQSFVSQILNALHTMARVYTTAFTYEGKNYMAVIGQITDLVSIYLPDESLHYLLPQGKFTYNPAEGVKIDAYTGIQSKKLVSAVMRAIEAKNGNNTHSEAQNNNPAEKQ